MWKLKVCLIYSNLTGICWRTLQINRYPLHPQLKRVHCPLFFFFFFFFFFVGGFHNGQWAHNKVMPHQPPSLTWQFARRWECIYAWTRPRPWTVWDSGCTQLFLSQLRSRILLLVALPCPASSVGPLSIRVGFVEIAPWLCDQAVATPHLYFFHPFSLFIFFILCPALSHISYIYSMDILVSTSVHVIVTEVSHSYHAYITHH